GAGPGAAGDGAHRVVALQYRGRSGPIARRTRVARGFAGGFLMKQFLVLVSLFLVPVFARADDKDPKPREKPKYETRQSFDHDGINKFYMGRQIAQVMGHLAAGWLDRPEREKEEQPAKLLPLLNLKEGDAVADIGAGSGYYSFKLSPLVG